MTLQDISKTLSLILLTNPTDLSAITPAGAYTSDLLSCVMAGAKYQYLWITLQAHMNIVAVAALLDLGAVIITEGATPDPEVIAKANQEGVILFSTAKPSFEIAGHLWEIGLRA